LVSANLLYTNSQIRQLGNDLAAQDADVVVVQEVTDEVLAQLKLSALWTNYAFRSTDPRPLFDGAATFSRYPIADGRTIDVAGHPMLLTDLETPAGTVRLINVHTVAPLTFADAALWAEQFPALDQLVADSPYPTVLAGDFNATLDHTPLENLVNGPVRDAFRVAGSGFGLTWPRLDFPAPQLMRLDHVLVSPTVSVASITQQVSVGSDHLRVVAELGIPRNR
jgi:endonuclease/exonuclease/phosphatase family metal-dependent hydrolase